MWWFLSREYLLKNNSVSFCTTKLSIFCSISPSKTLDNSTYNQFEFHILTFEGVFFVSSVNISIGNGINVLC